MNFLLVAFAASPPLLLLSFLLIPSKTANRHVNTIRRLSGLVSIASLILSLATATYVAVSGKFEMALVEWNGPLKLTLGVYVDSLTAVMQVLISFIGAIIVAYSIRYLDREPTQGRFLKWILFTLGAVLLLVVSRNLVMLTMAWMMTSFGLHNLLTHYSDRSWAVWAARKKFLISRLGDLMLLMALGLTWYCFGSVEYSEVFAAARPFLEATAETVSELGASAGAGSAMKAWR